MAAETKPPQLFSFASHLGIPAFVFVNRPSVVIGS